MKRLTGILFAVMFLNIPQFVKGQDHQTAISLRSGVSSGISLQFFGNENKALEGLLSFRNHGLQLTILKEYYRPILLRQSKHIYAYFGWGGHLGFEWPRYQGYHSEFPRRVYTSGPLAGVDAIAGAEYRFNKVPITLGLNFKPFAEFSVSRFFSMNLWDVGFSIKYSFKSKQ